MSDDIESLEALAHRLEQQFPLPPVPLDANVAFLVVQLVRQVQGLTNKVESFREELRETDQRLDLEFQSANTHRSAAALKLQAIETTLGGHTTQLARLTTALTWRGIFAFIKNMVPIATLSGMAYGFYLWARTHIHS